jgi:hypothetical protein
MGWASHAKALAREPLRSRPADGSSATRVLLFFDVFYFFKGKKHF